EGHHDEPPRKVPSGWRVAGGGRNKQQVNCMNGEREPSAPVRSLLPEAIKVTVGRADDENSLRDGRRGGDAAAELDLLELGALAGLDVDGVQVAVAAGHEGAFAGDEGRAVDWAHGLELPGELAVLLIEAVQRGIMRAEDDARPGEVGARGDLAHRLEGPAWLA